MARVIKAGDFVGPGEQLAAQYLEQNLPASWVVVCNKELVNPDGSVREVDFIVVGEHAVFAIEEKNWSGPIHGNENGWVLRSGESVFSPLSSVGHAARRLAGLLRSGVPLLNQRVSGHFVFSRVLLSADNVQVFVHDARVPDQVVHLSGCEEELARFDRLQEGTSSIMAFREKIIDRLTGLQDRPKIPREVGDYLVLESLPAIGPVRRLRAQHPDGSERLLKLVMKPSTADAERRQMQETALLREYDALRRLAESGIAPRVDPYFTWEQEHYWVLPIHPLGGNSLRADRTHASPKVETIWNVLEDAFSALAQVHSAGIIHRALCPDRIHIGPDGRIAFSDFVIARIHEESTVADGAEEMDPADVYRSPECRVDPGLAEPTSDVYGLAASLFYWITGNEPGEADSAFPPPGTLREDIEDQLGPELRVIFERCLAKDERERPGAEDVLARIRTARGIPDSETKPGSSSKTEMSPGDVVADQYRIVRLLGEGGSATTYLAEDLAADSLFVLKSIRNAELVARLSRAEFRSLMDLQHPNLPRVFDIRPAGSPFHLKLEYVRGSSLREVMEHHVADTAFCIRVGQEVLNALSYLGERNLIHRDVSPNNILVPDEESGLVKLIDFGLATSESGTSTAVGTPRYRAPEVERGGTWTPSCDVYSLGVVLFELLTGRVPYAVDDGVSSKDRLIELSEADERRFGRSVRHTLLKAVDPDPARRFQTASEFADALRSLLSSDRTRTVDGEEVVNPVVDALRAVYRNSLVGNADNRGLDTDFANETYVPTSLDTELLPRLLEGEYSLVILTGNPGDGKTAFLQRLRDALRERDAQVEMENPSGWRYRLSDRTYAAIYDASESHEGTRADDLLHEVLQPLSGAAPTGEPYTAAIAANDGRLLDFFERNGQLRYAWLWDQIRAQLLEGRESHPSIVAVDLKRRALVGYDPQEPSLFSGILQEFVRPHRWAACDRCVAREECPIRFNALSFRAAVLATSITRQLHQMLLAVHLGRERRPTVRDLRSALAFLITHDAGCQDIHSQRSAGESPLADTSRLYFNAAFDGSGSPDLFLDEWSQLDPADVPSPKLDRFLYFHRQVEQAPAVRATLLGSAERIDLLAPAYRLDDTDWLGVMKRRYFFEADPTSRPHGDWELPDPRTLLPYRHLPAFVDGLLGHIDETNCLTQLLLGISRADGVPEHACRGFLALRVTETNEEGLTVVKRFPVEEFRIRRTQDRDVFAEATVDQLMIEHRSGSPTLSIGLDLFEFLGRAAEGLTPGSEEQRALVEDLASFKNQLLARPTQEISIMEGDRRLHALRVEGAMIRREEAAR